MATLWVVLLNSWWTILWSGFCRTGMQNHLFKLFCINWLPQKQSAGFSICFFHRYIRQSGAWEPKTVETSNLWGGLKDLSPFTQCIMNNPKWRQQSGLTFWGACGRSNFRGMLKRTEAEESQNGTSSKMFHGYHCHGCPRCSPAPKQQKEVVAFEKIKKGHRKLTREMQFAQTLQRRQVILDEGFRKRKLSDMPSCLIRDCAGHEQTQAVDKEPVVWK